MSLHSHLKHKHAPREVVVQCDSKKGQKKDKVLSPNQPSLATMWERQKLLSKLSREHKELRLFE